MFIVNLLTLGIILYVGKKSYKKQVKISEKRAFLGNKQRSEQRISVREKIIKQEYTSEGAFTQNDRSIIAAAIGLAFALVGHLYYPLRFLSIPFITYASKENLIETYELLKKGKVGVETLVSIGVTGTVFLQRFVVAGIVILIARSANKLTSYVIQDSKTQLFNIFQQNVEKVWMLIDGVEVSVPFEKIQSGDIIVVHAGNAISVDGIVVDGMAYVDQHILTGEAMPVEKEIGEEVFALTIVLSGAINIRVEKTAQETIAAKITNTLNTTADYKSTVQLRAEMLSRNLVNPTLFASMASLVIVGFNGAVGIVACHPKNKIMAIAPIILLSHLSLASKQRILIKDGRSLELLSQVDTIIFDKTGTLTEEQPHTGCIYSCADYTENEILAYAAAAEYKQKHPLARAILQEASNRGLDIASIENCECKLGYGLVVKMRGQVVHIGSGRFMETEKIAIPSKLDNLQQNSNDEGYSLVMVAVDKQLIGAIEILPTLRSEAKQVVKLLKQRKNIKSIYIISGDNERPTKRLAAELGIEGYFAETLPENKADIIESLQRKGHFICYVGDGINDSIALKKAEVSVSFAGASTIATDTAQVILMDRGIEQLPLLFELADNLKRDMDNIFTLVITPSILGVSGVFLLGFGVTQAFTLAMTGVVLSVGYSILPMLKQLSLESPTKRDKGIQKK